MVVRVFLFLFYYNSGSVFKGQLDLVRFIFIGMGQALGFNTIKFNRRLFQVKHVLGHPALTRFCQRVIMGPR